MKHTCFVLYDSVYNSIFESQVIFPLINQLDRKIYNAITIVSYERENFSQSILTSISPDPRIHIITLKKIPFMGAISLHSAAHHLKKVLHTIRPDHITARGPLAGWIVAHANRKSIPTIVQARGLCAQEYLYAHRPASWWHRFRAKQYENIEKHVYGFFAQKPHVTVQSVSKALREYIIQTWQTPIKKIIVSTHDIPQAIAPKKVTAWRSKIRKKLSIPKTAHVYVYSGSAHTWQCPEKTVQFFAQEYKKNSNAFLLILTQSEKTFSALAQEHALPQSAYHITRIPHADMYHYLAAADTGLLFREKHCINWVSRPTKALEYQAVGLPIMHNDTVAMLSSHTV